MMDSIKMDIKTLKGGQRVGLVCGGAVSVFVSSDCRKCDWYRTVDSINIGY